MRSESVNQVIGEAALAIRGCEFEFDAMKLVGAHGVIGQ